MHHHVNDVSIYLQKDVIGIPLTGWLPPPHVFEDYPCETWDIV